MIKTPTSSPLQCPNQPTRVILRHFTLTTAIILIILQFLLQKGGLVSPPRFPVRLQWILLDSTGLHRTQCLVGHHTKFPDWTGFSAQSDSTGLKVQSSPVESTGLGPVRLYQTESPVKSGEIHWILPDLIC